MVFLCWNLNRQRRCDLVAELVRLKRVDVVVLLECVDSVGDLIRELSLRTGDVFHNAGTAVPNPVARVFTRFSKQFLMPFDEGKRHSVYRIVLPAVEEMLLAVVHLPSKLYWSEASQAQHCYELKRLIEGVEKRAGHSRTILMGDLNMNPFESGVVGGMGLNATMSRREAEKGFRTVQRKHYPFFFNPMWQVFAGLAGAPQGTYYYSRNEHVTYFWNVFDQVMVRPSLLQNLPDKSIEVVNQIGERSLLTAAGHPDRAVASDHLPVVATMRF